MTDEAIRKIYKMIKILNEFFRNDDEYITLRTKILTALNFSPYETCIQIRDYFISNPNVKNTLIKGNFDNGIKLTNNTEFARLMKKVAGVYNSINERDQKELLSDVNKIVEIIIKIQ
jgi:hypothetical protein